MESDFIAYAAWVEILKVTALDQKQWQQVILKDHFFLVLLFILGNHVNCVPAYINSALACSPQPSLKWASLVREMDVQVKVLLDADLGFHYFKNKIVVVFPLPHPFEWNVCRTLPNSFSYVRKLFTIWICGWVVHWYATRSWYSIDKQLIRLNGKLI
jgi:hypothetical protein